MKYLLIVFAFAALALATNDGCTETGDFAQPGPAGTDNVVFTVVNDFTLGQQCLGLDLFVDGSDIMILGVDRTGGIIQGYDPLTGAPDGTLPLSGSNTNCFGIAWNNDPDTDTYYTNDWALSTLFYTEDFGASWTTETNPAGTLARGMDFDGTDYWATNGPGDGIWRFQPGVGQSNYAIPEVPTQPSGLTVYPFGSDKIVAVTCYNTPNIYFYEWNGSSLTFYDSGACPAGVANAYGLASNEEGTLFLSYSDGANSHIAELSYTLLPLSRSTWGEIKSSF